MKSQELSSFIIQGEFSSWDINPSQDIRMVRKKCSQKKLFIFEGGKKLRKNLPHALGVGGRINSEF